MPEGAIYVGRPTVFGNPWTVGELIDRGKGEERVTAAHAVEMFRYSMNPIEDRPGFFTDFEGEERDLRSLRGHDLACWCPLDQPCHADVLLELANQ
jgi:hypothetical protein